MCESKEKVLPSLLGESYSEAERGVVLVLTEVLVTLLGLSGRGAVKSCLGLTFRAWFMPAYNHSKTIYTKIFKSNQSQVLSVPWQQNIQAFGRP